MVICFIIFGIPTGQETMIYSSICASVEKKDIISKTNIALEKYFWLFCASPTRYFLVLEFEMRMPETRQKLFCYHPAYSRARCSYRCFGVKAASLFSLEHQKKNSLFFETFSCLSGDIHNNMHVLSFLSNCTRFQFRYWVFFWSVAFLISQDEVRIDDSTLL